MNDTGLPGVTLADREHVCVFHRGPEERDAVLAAPLRRRTRRGRQVPVHRRLPRPRRRWPTASTRPPARARPADRPAGHRLPHRRPVRPRTSLRPVALGHRRLRRRGLRARPGDGRAQLVPARPPGRRLRRDGAAAGVRGAVQPAGQAAAGHDLLPLRPRPARRRPAARRAAPPPGGHRPGRALPVPLAHRGAAGRGRRRPPPGQPASGRRPGPPGDRRAPGRSPPGRPRPDRSGATPAPPPTERSGIGSSRPCRGWPVPTSGPPSSRRPRWPGPCSTARRSTPPVRRHTRALGLDVDHRPASRRDPPGRRPGRTRRPRESAGGRPGRRDRLRGRRRAPSSTTRSSAWPAAAGRSDWAGPTPAPTGAARSYAEARRAADFAAGLGRPVLRYEELGLFSLLADGGDPAAMADFVAEWLGPLLAHDEARPHQKLCCPRWPPTSTPAPPSRPPPTPSAST